MRTRRDHFAADDNGRQPDDPGNYEDHVNGGQQVPDDHAHRQPPSEPAATPKLPFHPAAEKFPLMSETELAALAGDIKAHGLNEEIETLDDGDGPMVLDGRNRYNACLMAGVTPRFRALSDNINPHDHLISKNLMRRHLTPLERALYAARMVTVEHGGDRRSKSNRQIGDLVTEADAARRIGVSKRNVERAGFIIKHTVPELLATIDTGIPWMALGYADKLAHSSDEDQRKWLADKKHIIEPVKRAAKPPQVPIPWTGNQFKALTDTQRAVILEKVATPGAIRALSPEKALAIAAKIIDRHAPAKDGPDQERANEGS